jgi:hypothetical protein
MNHNNNKSNKNNKPTNLSEDKSLKMGETSASSRDYSKVSATHRTTPYSDRKNSVITETNAPWMQRFTASTFGKLHAQIYPIMNKLTSLPENQNHAFHKKWQDTLSFHNKQPMTHKMTWKQMEQCLGISDFSQYKDFVLQCPGYPRVHQVSFLQERH